MTRTRSPSGAPGEGPLPSQSTNRCYLSWQSWHAVFFFSAPLTVNTLHGRDVPPLSSHPKEVKATCHPYLAVLWFLQSLAVGGHRRSSPSSPPFLPSVPIQAPDVSPAPATSSWSDWLVPLVLSLPVWSLPCTARQQQASTQTTLEGRIIIERAFLFQEVTAAVVVPAIRGAHIKHATPHPHTRQGYARLHARPRLPVGPRIAIPACGLACRTCTRGGNPGDRQQNVWTSCWPLTGGKGHPLGAPWEFPGGQRGLLHGLRMAARLFRLGRILCTPPRLIAANCKTLCLSNSFPQWCRCSCYVAACWPLLFSRWPRNLGPTSLDG